MENLTYLFVFVAAVSLLLVLVALRWTHSRLARALILALFALLLPAAYAAPASLLGRAKPVSLEWLGAHVQEASILSATFIENEAIYLTLQWSAAPNLYRIPWDRNTAEQLQQAMRDAQRDGSTAMMRLPFEPSWDRNEPRFYALPQPKMPDKPSPGPGIEYEHPGRAA
jgi:hypothetical protein